jgi:hypothetical protein
MKEAEAKMKQKTCKLSLQVAKASNHKGFSADYYSHSIVAGGLLEIS